VDDIYNPKNEEKVKLFEEIVQQEFDKFKIEHPGLNRAFLEKRPRLIRLYNGNDTEGQDFPLLDITTGYRMEETMRARMPRNFYLFPLPAKTFFSIDYPRSEISMMSSFRTDYNFEDLRMSVSKDYLGESFADYAIRMILQLQFEGIIGDKARLNGRPLPSGNITRFVKDLV